MDRIRGRTRLGPRGRRFLDQRWGLLGVAAGLLIAIVYAGCSSQNPATGAQSADYAATSAYLHAREQLIRSSVASLPAGRASMAAFVAHVKADCGGILSGVPVYLGSLLMRNMSVTEQQAALEKARFILELEGSVETAQREAQVSAVERFATLVTSLHWSDPRIATLVHPFIEIEMQRRHIFPLDVCKKLREWASTGYRKVPALAPIDPRGALGRKWAHAVAALGCVKSPTATLDVSAALRPYQRAGARPSTRSIELLEARLTLEELRSSLGAKRSLFHAVGLSPSWAWSSVHRGLQGRPEIASARLPSCDGASLE